MVFLILKYRKHVKRIYSQFFQLKIDLNTNLLIFYYELITVVYF